MEAATAADSTLRYLVGYITLGSAAKGYVSDLTVLTHHRWGVRDADNENM